MGSGACSVRWAVACRGPLFLVPSVRPRTPCPDDCGRRDFLCPRRVTPYREVRRMVGTLERTRQATPLPPAPAEVARDERRPRRDVRRLNTALAPVAAFALLIAIWKLVVVIGGYPPFLLPPPETVARSFWEALRSGI